jgi:hypothetical protein
MKVAARPRSAAHPFAEHFAAAVPAERPGLVAAFLPTQQRSRAIADMLWRLRLTDPAAFDAGLDLAAARVPGHLLVLGLLAEREAREERHDEAKALARKVLHLNPSLTEWRRYLARNQLVAPSADPSERVTDWQLALAAVPQGLPRLALLAQRAIADGRTPDLSTFDAQLAHEAAALTSPRGGADDKTGLLKLLSALTRFLGLARGPAELLAASPEEAAARERLAAIYQALQAARDVALVGNAPTLASSGAGAEIDRHDLVVRCNYPVLGKFATDVGTKTDLILFHGAKRRNLAQLLARDPRYPTLPAMSSGPSGPIGAASPVPPDAEPRPAAPAPLERLVDGLCYEARTTGLFGAVLIALVFGKPLRLYGFDFFRPGRAGHYFGKAAAAPHHDLAYERWYLTSALPALRPSVTLHRSAGG